MGFAAGWQEVRKKLVCQHPGRIAAWAPRTEDPAQPRRHPRQVTRALHRGPTIAHIDSPHKLLCVPAHPAHSRPLQSTLARSTVVMVHRPPEPTQSAGPHARGGRCEARTRRTMSFIMKE
eukprot:205539-Prymnesium_polylepis.1